MKRYEKKVHGRSNSHLKEIAYIGECNGLIVQVYTDHNPPHFHVVKKDEYEVRIIEMVKIPLC